MDIRRENGVVVATRLAAPQLLTLGESVEPEIVAAAVGLKAGDIVGQPVVASTGNNFLFAEVRSRDVLKTALGNNEVFARHLPMNRTVGVHLYVDAKEHGVEIQTRMFAPLYGVPEDPATGSANITLIGLLAHKAAEKDMVLAKTVGQGFDMGRPSLLEASAEKKDGKVVATYIGGRCAPVMTGEIDLA
jgi:trans-2,3-dihydro-3-hydroxyanthranilate isomerase